MNVSPLMMPTRKVDHAAAPVRPVYTTATGQTPRGEYVEENPFEFPSVGFDFDEYDPHCFVCGRHTDHFGEHEALVEAGLAYYTGDGSVHKTEKYDADLAAKIQNEEYERMYGHLA
jgi:hypothetical protein